MTTATLPRGIPAPAAPLLLAAPKPGAAVVPACELKRALDELQKFVARKSTLPVLANVLIEARPGRLTLSATDLEKALIIRMPAKGFCYFSITVPLATLRDMLARVDCNLRLSIEGYTLIIQKQGAGTIRIKGIAGEDFPALPTNQSEHYFSVDSARLSKEIDRVARGAATDEARPVFTAIYCQIAAGRATLASADSYRLHVASIGLDRMGHAGDCLIPAKNLQALASILPKKSTMLHCFFAPDRKQIAIRWNGHTFLSRLIEGNFPAYQRIMPDSMPDHYAVVDAKQALELVELVGKVVAHEANSIIKIGWRVGKKSQLVISAENDNASQTEYISADLDQGEMTQEHFMMANYRYVADALKSISGYAVVRFWTPQKPLTIRPLETDEQFTAVIMPMHTIR